MYDGAITEESFATIEAFIRASLWGVESWSKSDMCSQSRMVHAVPRLDLALVN